METKMKVKMIASTMTPEQVIACAGKLCYSNVGVEELEKKQTQEDIERFVNMLVSMGHESPLEHASFTFAIEGVSRSLTHQLVRHRIASYSQQSQRYVKEDQFEYVVPTEIKNNEVCHNLYIEHMSKVQEVYDFLVDSLIFNYIFSNNENEGTTMDLLRRLKIDENKFASFAALALVKLCEEEGIEGDYEESISQFTIENKRLILSAISKNYPKVISTLTKKAIENARYVLPNACETKIVVTMNLRSLINFCRHRVCRRAQEEIRELALAMIDEVEQLSPLLAKCLGATCQFGKCPEGNMTCGKPYPKKIGV